MEYKISPSRNCNTLSIPILYAIRKRMHFFVCYIKVVICQTEKVEEDSMFAERDDVKKSRSLVVAV